MREPEPSPEENLEAARRRQAQRREKAARDQELLTKRLKSPLFLGGVVIGGLFLVGLSSAIVTGVSAPPFNPEVCKTEAGRLRHVQQCLGVLDAGGSWTHKDLSAEKCKRYIGAIMGRSSEGMNTVSESEDLVRIEYERDSDGKRFTYECATLGDNIVWRGIDIFSPGEGPGRWRKEDARPIGSI